MADKRLKTSNEIDIYLGKQLSRCRKTVGESQQKLAKVLGVTFQQVQKYEKGTNRIAASKLYLMHQHYNVPIEYFFSELENILPAINPTENDYLNNKETITLVKSYYRISNTKTRKKLLALIKSIKS